MALFQVDVSSIFEKFIEQLLSSCVSENGQADTSSITNDRFIMQYFKQIFGRNSYSDFHPIVKTGDGSYSVNGVTFTYRQERSGMFAETGKV